MKGSKASWFSHASLLFSPDFQFMNVTFRLADIIVQNISNKMQIYTVYLYLETALHVSGVTSTHHQERIQLLHDTGRYQ